MNYKLEDLPCLNAAERKILASRGIRNSDDLLQKLSLPAQRDQFSKISRIPVRSLTDWAGIADLVRIKGMGVATAELLVESGQVRSLQEFINRMILDEARQNRSTTGWQALQTAGRNLLSLLTRTSSLSRRPQTVDSPEAEATSRIAERESVRRAAGRLRGELSAYAKGKASRVKIPTGGTLAELAEEAVELRPRLVLEIRQGAELFRETMKTRAWRMAKVTTGLLSLALGMLVVFEFAAAWITVKDMREIVASDQPGVDAPSQLYHALLEVSSHAFVGSSVAFALAIIAVLALGLCIVGFSPLFISYPASVLLMNNTVHRNFFIKAIQVPLQKEKRDSLIALAIFALVCIPIALYTYSTDFDLSAAALQSYSLPAALFGGMVGLVASSATYYHVLTGVPIDWEQERESLKRYLLYMLVHIVYAFVGIYLILYLVLAGTSAAYTAVYERSILPNYQRALDAACDRQALQLAEGDKTNPLYALSLDECNLFIKPLIVERFEPAIRMVDPDSSIWSQAGSTLRWAMNTVMVWMILSGALLMFVLPYLSIGGWWRGIFYIVLLIAASRLEGLLRANASLVLGLDANTLGAASIIAFFILTSALLFDWAYDALTEKKKVCPNCQSLIDDHIYCPVCGLAQ